MSSKTILVVAPYGFNDRMTNFIEFISARFLSVNGWHVKAIARSLPGQAQKSRWQEIEIEHYQNLFFGFATVFKIIVFDRPDVVHVHNLRNNHLGILSALLCKFFGVTLVFTEYGLLHDHYLIKDRDNPLKEEVDKTFFVASIKQLAQKIFQYHLSWKKCLRSYFFHWAFTHADQVLFVSKHNVLIAKELGVLNATYLPHLVDEARWENKGTDLDQKAHEHNQLVAKKIIDLKGKKNILFVGQIKLRKGWDIFLRAIPYIPAEIVDHFLIVTATSFEPPPEVKDLIVELKIETRVVFLGIINDSTLMKQIYDVSTAVVIPSRYEGFGLATVESFAANRPIVASKVEALTDTLEDSYNSILIPPENPQVLAQAVSRLVGDRDLQQKLVAGGLVTLQKLKSPDLQNAWLKFYENFLKY